MKIKVCKQGPMPLAKVGIHYYPILFIIGPLPFMRSIKASELEDM